MIHELEGCRLPASYVLTRADGSYVSQSVARSFYDDKTNLVWVFPKNTPGQVLTYFAAGMELRFKDLPQAIKVAAGLVDGGQHEK